LIQNLNHILPHVCVASHQSTCSTIKFQTMKNLILIIAFLFIGINNTTAQETKHTDTDELTGNIKTITGYVIDECGITLGGATIRVKNHPSQTIQAEENGSFSLEVEKGTTLEFLFVGMIAQTVKIGYANQYFVIMKEAELSDLLVYDCNPCEQKRGISVASQYMFHY
jgi:hypothetical protein